jgi:hypothetical protein
MRVGLAAAAGVMSAIAATKQLQRRTRSTMFISHAFDGSVDIAASPLVLTVK